MDNARDPYPDALRTLALLVVVLGHWVATLPRFESERLVGTAHILDAWPPADYFTWLAQVVPLFVFVSAAVSVDGVRQRRRDGEPHLQWWAERGLGLARPTLTYLAVLAGLVLLSLLTREGILETLNHSLTVHLWFLLILLGVQLVLPLSVRADERWGIGAVLGLVLLILAVDALRARPGSFVELARFGSSVTAQHDRFAWGNAVLVWLVAQQLGIAWWNGRLVGRGVGVGLVLLGLAWLTVAVAVGYPVSMVNGNLGGHTNLLPPTLALLGVMWLQAGGVVLFETPVRTFLQRRRLGRSMALLGALGLQLYLWHKLAELPAAWLGQRFGWPLDAGMPSEPGFWLGRLKWIGLCALVIAPVLVAVAAFERHRRQAVAAAQGTPSIAAGGAALLAGLGVSLLLGAYPGALVGLPLVAMASWLLRAHRQA
ncbi:acyltransferase family protein [Halomonas sp. MCCC 1A17488]|uniref:Acyltransferase family protein n=1 Tax=Billgrantia sulfidoxydans TaxID=2733484 RepID=A0ABX7W7B6_9GAMM|nr:MULTISPECIES: acyltransferase family protein [Halomonas]MCE8017767.1 acyltransferase family protein [Halomonas sp. MCCC 1A17488]MCG3241100.1 acyltransferase family protein [Halomonas sp. MCCC 1A17488]QPP48957.1 acyltransferase family protein [Halomonas sp. SS10-MC5]QTP56273.1 acyltransferase family protein [Halomonas sulfidoxydans]